MKKILGLDLGTNSIGWAVLNSDTIDGKEVLNGIEAKGCRIIPMTADQIGNFESGSPTETSASVRTKLRATRKIIERSHLRRERLHRVLDIMNFLPQHYADSLTRYGKFMNDNECKLPWVKGPTGKQKFLFESSFQEMLSDFRLHQPELVKDGRKIPYDWTIYYLRKKALTQKIEKEELAWILLNFNQKRGYYQLRGEEDNKTEGNKKEEYSALKVISVEATNEKKGNDTLYNVYLENGGIYKRMSRTPLDWVGKVKEFIVTTVIDADGNVAKDKNGKKRQSYRIPNDDDWNLLKKKTEADIELQKVTVGTYIYDKLLANPRQKVRGKLVHTIERKFYKDELIKILEAQIRFHHELNDTELYVACVDELYQSNDSRRNILENRDFTHLFVDDIIFYQRPLKSKKSLIDDCQYESYTYKDKASGEEAKAGVKCIAKSHPLFQEFRLWQFLSNLRIYRNECVIDGKRVVDADVTSEFIADENAYVALFDWLNSRKEVDQKALLKYPGFNIKTKISEYRWNYSDKSYPCNETHSQITAYLKKAGVPEKLISKEVEERLWHILYSVEDKAELEKALKTFAQKYVPDGGSAFADVFKKFPPFKKDYGSYSAKAIKKLLPLMRCGKYWNEASIDDSTKLRIMHIIDGEYDESIKERVRNKAINLTDMSHFRGLPLWLACYIVYDRHSEAKETAKWKSPEDVDEYLRNFKQYSLRNSIVEQIVTETLRMVRDIWKKYGKIDEIHVELGREIKNTAEKRKQMAERAIKNENTNLRIKAILAEFMNSEFEIDNVRPYSPYQQELLRIYEDGALSNATDLSDEMLSVMQRINKEPSRADILRYKLWLDQKYRSPYTGRPIPLSKLFTTAYEIEHIIPRARYFDDSQSNKVICEAAVNKKKGHKLGYEFIKDNHGEIIETSFGNTVRVLSVDEYKELVANDYKGNHAKKKKLLMDDIPEEFIQRQLNDSRYISRLIMSLLSSIVRDDDEQESISRHVIPCTGSITDRLKKDWGINDVWNKIVLPRFRRMNEITGSNCYTSLSRNGHEITAVPFELQKGFNKKRIDHRHHTMDAIVIACANRNIVNYLNNESARKGAKVSRIDLQRQLCHKEIDENGSYKWLIDKPWATFTQDTYTALTETIISIKQNLRILTKSVNYYQHYENGTKKMVKQATCKDNWAIRKPLHKATFTGEVNLRKIKSVSLQKCLENPKQIVDKELKAKICALLAEGHNAKQIKKYFEVEKDTWSDIDIKKIPVYYFSEDVGERYFASRCDLLGIFSKVTDAKKAIDIIGKITDTGIQKILMNHLHSCNDNPAEAFSADGIDQMNRNIVELNNGHFHQPILKVRKYEMADKYAVGQRGNKGSKYVEAEKGTNIFFAIYEYDEPDKRTGETVKKRSYQTIPLRIVVDRMKQHQNPVPAYANGVEPKYILSPNDLVYVPTQAELAQGNISVDSIDLSRVYKFVGSSKYQAYYIPFRAASPIADKVEFSSQNKAERALDGTMIKDVCRPIKIDRLGNIIKIG